MKSKAVIRIVVLLATSSYLGLCQSPPAKETAPSLLFERGVIVESIVKGKQAEKRGVRSGDILVSWSRGEQKGRIDSPFALAYISIEQASRGLVAVHGRRGTQKRTWLFDSDSWGIQTRPQFLGTYLPIYQDAMALASAGKAMEAAERLESAVDPATHEPVAWLAPWFMSSAGTVLSHAARWKEYDDVLDRAIQLSVSAGPVVMTDLLRQWASSFESRGDLKQADKYYHAALLEAEKLGPETMLVANSLLLLGSVDLQRDDTDQANVDLKRALTIATRLAPYSVQAAAIFEDFGILFEDRTDLEKAEDYYRKALSIEEQHFRASRQLANTLANLGTLAHHRLDLTRAETYYRRALIIAGKVEENGPQIADILNYLGECMLDQGSVSQAEGYQKRSLAIREKTPGTLGIALTLASLGRIGRIRRDFAQAEKYFAKALAAAADAKAPDLELSSILHAQADLFRDRGDYIEAEETYRTALRIVEKLNPGSIDHAEVLAELAGCLRHQEQISAARALYQQALAILNQQSFHLGGVEEDRSRYRAWYINHYQGYIDTLVREGRQQEAFEVLEGSRARTLLDMLSQAHIDVRRGANPRIIAQERELQRSLQAKTESRVRLVTTEHTEEQALLLDREIEDLLTRAKEIEAQLRLENPEYAALTEPRQMSAAEIQSLLDDNTLLLEYSLGEDSSSLWVATNNDLFVYDLPPKRKIEHAARKVYDLLTRRKITATKIPDATTSDRNYYQAAQQLSRIVLGPIAQQLGTKRLVIVADGALQYIPFAALPFPDKRFDSTPLIVKHEIVNLPSASVLAEIRRQAAGRPKLPGQLAILADPVFDGDDPRVAAGSFKSPNPPRAQGGYLTRSANDLGFTRNGRVSLDRLIYTRKEADAVMATIPPGKGFQALDFDATRATSMSGILKKYRIVHFATHGLLNNRHPELSGLVLSLVNKQGKRQDGFLKLQDIYQLKIPADLVVLSGCDTGLGEEINGEGLIGLTRGFMYAGASRVVASLWSVSDMATANLMGKFYKSMERDGMRPAAALRAAQIQMWAQQQWRDPYFWAAFQLQGDWR